MKSIGLQRKAQPTKFAVIKSQPTRRVKRAANAGKVAAAALTELRTRQQALEALQAIAEFSLDGTVLAANENFLALVGFTLAEIQGKSHSILVSASEKESPAYRQSWADLAAGKGQAFPEARYLGKAGREVWLQVSLGVIPDANGEPLKVLCSAVDVTAKRNLLNQMAELKVRAEILNLTSIVSESDLKGDILDINEKFIEVSQYSREELIGHPHNTTRHPDMPEETFKELWGTIGRGKTFRGIIKNRKKDGTPYYVDAVVAPVLGDNGKPRKYIGVRYDITDAEIERQKMRGILAGIDEAFAYIEFDPRGNILHANGNFLKTLGYAKEEIIGHHHSMFVERAYGQSPEYAKFWADLAAGKSQIDTFKRKNKAGEVVWVQAAYSPVRDEMGRSTAWSRSRPMSPCRSWPRKITGASSRKLTAPRRPSSSRPTAPCRGES